MTYGADIKWGMEDYYSAPLHVLVFSYRHDLIAGQSESSSDHVTRPLFSVYMHVLDLASDQRGRNAVFMKLIMNNYV